MRRAAADEAARVVNEVEALPAPDGATMFEDVYAEAPWNLVEARDGAFAGC
jgi:TPP-dependent pyruvate/acetoin dehydrogenase alpha subunit